MEIKLIKCPSCGADIDFETDKETMFCKYCGAKLMIVENDEMRIKLKEMDNEHELKKNEQRDSPFGFALLITMVCIMFGAPLMFTGRTTAGIVLIVAPMILCMVTLLASRR